MWSKVSIRCRDDAGFGAHGEGERGKTGAGDLAKQVMAIVGQGQFQEAFLGRSSAATPARGGVARGEHGTKAHGFAQNLGVLDLVVGQQAEQGFQPRSGAGVFVAVQQGEAEEHAARMVKPAQVGAGGVVKAGLGPVVGVGAPGGVVQQAGGLHQAQAVLGQPRGTGVQQEFVQHLAGAGDARGGDVRRSRAASISGSRWRRRSGITS